MYVDDNFEKWYENISNKFKEELIQLEEVVKKEKEDNRYRFKISIVIFLIITIMLTFFRSSIRYNEYYWSNYYAWNFISTTYISSCNIN